MSHNVSLTTATSGNSQDLGGSSSGYKSGLTSMAEESHQAREAREAREKLKEELLRQYEAGQLRAPQTARVSSVPRQIPTIEENRASLRRMPAVPSVPAVPAVPVVPAEPSEIKVNP